MAVKKVTVNLPEETVEDIRKLAERYGTNTEAIKRAIANEKFLSEEIVENKSKVLLESPDGTTREVIFR